MRVNGFILLILLALVSCRPGREIPPNVVFILTDDQGWGDLSLHGNVHLETPNMDRLAKEGLEFNHFYVSPLCAPSRASILSGRYHLSTGVVSVSKGLEIMDTEETTIAELFKANGYTTGIFGKWHNGQHYPNRPNDQGFDEFLGFCAGHWSNYFNTELEHNNGRVSTHGFITDILTDAAIQFIESAGKSPFFCFIPYNAPHSPHQVPDSYFDKYKGKGLDDELSSIYGMVENLDDNIGRILQALKDNGLDENTIVIFLTDNGPNGNRYNGGMRGIKGSVHEGGVRVPCFVRWTNTISPGRTIETPAAHVDIYPTLLELCHLKPIETLPQDGVSLASAMLKEEEDLRIDRNIFTHVNSMEIPLSLNSGGFRNTSYRFVFEKDQSQLYDLRKDPAEKDNLSVSEPDLTNDFLNTYRRWVSHSTVRLSYERPAILSRRGVELPAYEAALSAGIRFKEGHGWAHDWVETWNSTADSLYWTVDCRDPGRYAVEVEYLCKASDAGSLVRLSAGGDRKTVTVSKAFATARIASPDRVPRKEAYEMEKWGVLKVDTFDIPAGETVVSMKAEKVKNVNVAEIKCLRFTFVSE